MSSLQEQVSYFLAERDNVMRAIKACPTSNMEDYWRWQGHAEARRVLQESLERAGVDLAAEPAPLVAALEKIHYLTDAPTGGGDRYAFCAADGYESDDLAANPCPTLALARNGIFRDEATVKAEAIREAAEAQRLLAADSRTSNGQAEHTDRADWLDDYANRIDPARLEGAHP